MDSVIITINEPQNFSKAIYVTYEQYERQGLQAVKLPAKLEQR